MALETTTYINGLVVTNPTAADPKSQGDDHLRLIKSAIKNTFSVITGAIVATHTELNFAQGVTSAIQTQLNNLMAIKGVIAGQIWTGIHDFTGSVIIVATQALGDISNRVASTQFAMTMQSPAFSGIPTTPTAAIGTVSNQIASTKFVMAQAFSAVSPASISYIADVADYLGNLQGETDYVLPAGIDGQFKLLEQIGLFAFDSLATDPVDGETCIMPTGGVGRWKLICPSFNFIYAWLEGTDFTTFVKA